ncbi:hypothetical protein [Sulfurihydrogenibium sp. YO3AOP1]|uniref:hypothetical protein n=1 Tax=Sulfurihydrogenibium sp. (strain YO3AOP1) TaxID=436114 RepID=UPI0018DDE228|nr:hypothetical protein [Sulfurihydrogenibium sp. YO3AOP1]
MVGEKLNFCYLNLKNEDNYIRAGGLIVDERTKPVEFRITSKVEVNDLQKILYGETFKEGVIIDKVLLELLNSLESDFTAIFILDKNLLSIRKDLKKPVFLFEKHDEFRPKEKYAIKIQNLTGKFPALNLKFFPEDENIANQIGRVLNDIYKNIDILEPFSRIIKAIEYIESEGLND